MAIHPPRGAAPEGAVPEPQTLGFLLLEDFTLISLASAIEPLSRHLYLSGNGLIKDLTAVSELIKRVRCRGSS